MCGMGYYGNRSSSEDAEHWELMPGYDVSSKHTADNDLELLALAVGFVFFTCGCESHTSLTLELRRRL